MTLHGNEIQGGCAYHEEVAHVDHDLEDHAHQGARLVEATQVGQQLRPQQQRRERWYNQ